MSRSDTARISVRHAPSLTEKRRSSHRVVPRPSPSSAIARPHGQSNPNITRRCTTGRYTTPPRGSPVGCAVAPVGDGVYVGHGGGSVGVGVLVIVGQGGGSVGLAAGSGSGVWVGVGPGVGGVPCVAVGRCVGVASGRVVAVGERVGAIVGDAAAVGAVRDAVGVGPLPPVGELEGTGVTSGDGDPPGVPLPVGVGDSFGTTMRRPVIPRARWLATEQ